MVMLHCTKQQWERGMGWKVANKFSILSIYAGDGKECWFWPRWVVGGEGVLLVGVGADVGCDVISR